MTGGSRKTHGGIIQTEKQFDTEVKMDLVRKLQEVLDRSVESGEECGCQLAVYRNGEFICDLSAGYTTPEKTRKVDSDTLFPVFSVGKGVATTMMLILRDQGKLDFDDPVVKFWKEYGVKGKEITTIRNVLSHRAGLYEVPPQLTLEERYQWETITSALAASAPFGPIGGKHTYHSYTYGALTGRIAELADGRPFRRILKEEILDPLQIDGMFFGISREQFEGNLAPIDGSAGMMDDGRLSHNKFEVLHGLNPSSNGCINARSLAKMYASLIGKGLNGVRLVSEKTIEEATIPCRAKDDTDMRNWDRFGLGYALSGPVGNYGKTFGHGGACGSEGFADKETGYAVGFTKNKLNRTHPNHPTRNAISEVLGLQNRIW